MRKSPSTELVESEASAAAGAAGDELPVTPVVVPNAGATKTPAQWAEVYFPNTGTGRPHDDLWKHAAAEQLHGWAHYFARSNKHPQLTAAEYEGALKAAEGNDFKPSQAADYRDRS